MAKDFSRDPHIVIAKLDCVEAPEIAERYGIQGYPTIKCKAALIRFADPIPVFPRDSKDSPIDYTSGRTEESFLSWINDRSQTFRKVGGALNELAGRVSSFDDIVATVKGASDAEKAKSLLQNLLQEPEASRWEAYYIKTLDQVKRAPSYVARERERLSGLLRSATVSKEQYVLAKRLC